MSKNETPERLELFVQLSHFFEAYFVLTEQMAAATDAEEVELLGRLTNLRQQTQIRVDAFLRDYPAALERAFEEESDEQIIKVRTRIRDLMSRSQEISDGLTEKMVKLRAHTKEQAEALARGQRVMRGYARRTPKTAHYVETSK